MFSIDPMARKPVYEQIIEQTERFILIGVLSAGDQLPSVRSLSLKLTINPNTILKAYADLDGRDIVRSVPGKGYFVSEDAKAILVDHSRLRLSALKREIGELAIAGIPKDEVIALVEAAYQTNDSSKGDLT